MKRCQQFELYASEIGVPRGPRFDSAQEAEAWISEVRETRWFQDNFPNVRFFEFHARDRRRRESVGAFVPLDHTVLCELLPEHLNALDACHEAAHGLAEARYDSHAHDPWFARIYLELVYLMLGSSTYDTLREAFVRGGIDHDPGPECSHALRGAIALGGDNR